jgi:hypothetical protein
MKYIYGLVAVLAVISYVTTRDYMIATPINDIIVSNLTVNYVLLAMITGGVAGWLGNTKIFNKVKNKGTRLMLTTGLTCVVALLFLMVMASGGIKMRW